MAVTIIRNGTVTQTITEAVAALVQGEDSGPDTGV